MSATIDAAFHETRGGATVDDADLDVLFRNARTQNKWQPDPVPTEQLHAIYDLLKMGPTSANCSPARFVFLTTPEAKEKLRPALSAGNLDKTLTAPVVVVVAHDPTFYEHLPRLFPHADAKSWFSGSEALAQETAFRNGTLQGAYLIMAARAVGLDTGPMSGFDKAQVDQAFFAENGFKTNFLINLGHGDPTGVKERLPRFAFDEVCKVL